MVVYIDYSSSVVGHTYEIWQAYLQRAYASSMKCMYISSCGDIADCSEFI